MSLDLRNYEPALMEGATIAVSNQVVQFGNTPVGTTNANVGGVGIEVGGSNNTAGGVNIIASNSNAGTSAFVDLFLQNNLANSSGTHFAVLNYNSSTYNNTAFGTAIAVPNQLALYGTDGPTMIGTFATGAPAYVNFVVGGSATSNEVQRITTTGMSGVGGYLATSTNGIGYGTGAGGAVTQLTNRTTGVTLSKLAGQITTNNTSLAAATAATFVVTNTLVAATDVIICSIASGTTSGNTDVYVSATAAGSFSLTVANQTSATAETGAIVINFAIHKSVAS